MAVPNNLSGIRWRCSKLSGDGVTFAYLCSIVSQDLDRKVEFDDNMLADCASPNALPTRQSTPKAITWDLSGSGTVDAARFADMEDDLENQNLQTYQLIRDLPAANGGVTYTGQAYTESLKETKTDNGVVKFSFAFKGQGRLTKAAAAQ